MKNPEFHEISKQIVAEFLNTVVIIDDEPQEPNIIKPVSLKKPEETELSNSETEQNKVIKTAERKNKSTQAKNKDKVFESNPHSIDYTKTATAFAQKGIIASLLKPKKENIDTISGIVKKILHSTDIFILDWDILKDRGTTAIKLIKLIMKDSCTTCPQQLRLIIIYTGEQGVDDIFSKIEEKIKVLFKEKVSSIKRNLEINYGPNKIIILAKEGVAVATGYEKKIVSNNELPDKIIDEFTLMTEGLMRNALMKGLTQIRKNAFKLLNKFPIIIDPAYLTHRVLSPCPKDAEDQLSQIIADEIKSILLDGIISNVSNSDIIKKYLNKEILTIDTFNFKLDDLLKKGWENSDPENERNFSKGKRSQLRNDLTKGFSLNKIKDEKPDEDFSYLLNIKTFYEKQTPFLTLGTIIKPIKSTNNELLFCVHPKCDCVRLNNTENSFIFVPLIKINDKKDYKREQLVLKIDQKFERYAVNTHAKTIQNIIFIQSNVSNELPIYAQIKNNEYNFMGLVCGKKKQFKWICEVKNDTAQKYANDLAANLSRVGADFSEWMKIDK